MDDVRGPRQRNRSTGEVKLNINAIPLKTRRGRDEIRTRAHRLSPMARRLLILANGHQTVTELTFDLDCLGRDQGVHEALEALIEAQFLRIRDDFDGLARGRSRGPGWHAIR
jgi:hypothetical protein